MKNIKISIAALLTAAATAASALPFSAFAQQNADIPDFTLYSQQVMSNAQRAATTVLNPRLTILSITCGGDAISLSPTLSTSVKDYSIAVPAEADSLSIKTQAFNKKNTVSINGMEITGASQTNEIGLNEFGDVLSIVVTDTQKNVSTEYSITVKRYTMADITFDEQTDGAVLCVYDFKNKRVFPNEDGTYTLPVGIECKYTYALSGYVGRTVPFTLTEDDDHITTVALDEAEKNENINEDLPAQWPNFRADKNNNGVVDTLIPNTADDAVLYWAVKRGEGYSGGAMSSPIIVNDWLIVCAQTSLYRINRFTGEVDESVKGTMVTNSNFNIIPPVYSNGMIFVGLANGQIQAFNAETLESLWVYQNENKGQPNSPLTVHDGYLYTGFWNSETKDADYVCLSITDEDPSQTNEKKTATWTYTAKGGFYWAGAYVCDDFLMVGTDDGESGYLSDTSALLTIDPKTGELIDKIENLNGDIRSSICYDDETDRYYFTTKGGSFYGAAVNEDGTFKRDEDGVQGYDLKEIYLNNYAENPNTPPMSTCTPVVHNGRAYIGVSGTSQFGKYSGHNISVIDLESWEVAYKVRTMGYPQTSGLLTTAYEDEDGYSYIYFFDNYTPGVLRVIKDKPGVTEVVDGVTERYTSGGTEVVLDDCAPVLFTPSGAQAQYAICSPICDEYGTLYFKNDSAYLMAVGSRIEDIEITAQPDKTVYAEGEEFDTTGMKVIAHFANGLSRDITDEVVLSDNAADLTTDDTDVTVYFKTVMYGDKFDAENGNQTNVQYDPYEAYVDITVISAEDSAAVKAVEKLISEIGEVNSESGEVIAAARTAYDALDESLREYVSNYDVLTNAEEEYAPLKEVYDLIEAIGDIDYSTKESVENAAEHFDALTEEQQSKITNAEKLSAAKEALDSILADITAVEEKIAAIGNVELSKEELITAARSAYDDLAETSKAGVSNYDELARAEAVLAGLKGDVAAVEELIDSIGEVSYSKKADIEAARAGYEALNAEQQAEVSNLDVLVSAEEKLAEMTAQIKEVEDKIASIGEVSLSKADVISETAETYDKLSDELKNEVSNYDVLVSAQEKLDSLLSEIDEVEKLIDSIGEVSKDSGDAIKAAEDAFAALSDEQKAAVSNADVLTAARAAFDKLTDDAEKPSPEKPDTKPDTDPDTKPDEKPAADDRSSSEPKDDTDKSSSDNGDDKNTSSSNNAADVSEASSDTDNAPQTGSNAGAFALLAAALPFVGALISKKRK